MSTSFSTSRCSSRSLSHWWCSHLTKVLNTCSRLSRTILAGPVMAYHGVWVFSVPLMYLLGMMARVTSVSHSTQVGNHIMIQFLNRSSPPGEEMHNPAKNLPLVMIGTVVLNGTLGLAFLFALLFCLGDVESVLTSRTGFPIIQIFYNTTGSTAATTAMMMPFIIVAITSTFGLLASASRTLWAFARDEGFPFSPFFAKVSSLVWSSPYTF